MDIEKFNTEKFITFYDKIKLELTQIESDFLNLEKEYFNLTPLFDQIFQKLQKLSHEADINQAPLLKYRINSLYKELMNFHHTSGYNAEAFHILFGQLKSILNKLPDEIFSESAVKLIKEKIKNEARKWLPEGLPSRSTMRKFIALKNDDMTFLVPFKKKIWEKTVDNRKKLKIQIKSISGDNIFPFRTLLSSSQNPDKKQKLAVLLELENSNKLGILTDQIEGVLVFSKKFLKKHLEYFPVGDGNYKPFIQLKGKRYFMWKPNEDT